jgi:hypothetical protein
MSTFINIGIVHINLDQVLRIVDDGREVMVYYVGGTTEPFLEEEAKILRVWLGANSKDPTIAQDIVDAYMHDKPQGS